MRLKHIYITKEGEPMANPEMELLDWPSAETRFMEYQKYHSGLLPFEDKKDALDFIPWEYHGYNGTILSQHWNTLIPVELEVEVVEQEKSMSSDEWIDYKPGYLRGAEVYAIRKVLRIKP